MRRDDPSGLILLVEDNRNLSEMVGEYLESKGFGVDYASDGLDGYRLAVDNSYDVIVLDLMLPRLDGTDLCRKLRNEAKKSTPVLMLTARDTLNDKVTGLEAGADDYLVKPFAMSELLARMRAVARRTEGVAGPGLTNGIVALDPATHEATIGDLAVRLSAREFSLLQSLLIRPGAILSRTELEKRLYGWNEEVESNAVEFLIHALRKKLGADTIKNVRGVGWMVPKKA
jgi:two-component system OmpR family response regulator